MAVATEPGIRVARSKDITTETLRMLYPRDLARTLIQAFNDAQPQDDGVLLGGVTPEELEQLFVGDDTESASSEETAEMQRMKQSLRDNLGKKIVDIPGTPEADAEFLEKEIDTAISVVLSSWFSMLHIALTLANSQTVRLTERLEPVTPILLNKRQPRLTWQEASSNGISLTSEAVDQLYEAFVQRLRPLVDAAPNGLLLPCRPRYAICKDAQGYCLALRP